MKITIKNLQNKVPVNPKRIIKIVQKVLFKESIKKSGEITVCFVNDKKIKALNSKYLNRNNPTDVIAFNITDAEDKRHIFADIAISADTAVANARAFKTTPLFELYLYVIHGVLHVLGYDDRKKSDKLLMRKKEEQILKVLGLSS
ncbi:MAG: rRNA maturation RNase YbeY [Candidatus Omnitrophota bacterium]